MKIGRIVILLTFCCILIPLFAEEPFRVGMDLKEPRLIKKVEIDYPDSAKMAGFEGPFVAKIVIDQSGSIKEIEPIYYPGLYSTAFLEVVNFAIKQWRFAPSFVKGKPVPVTANVSIIFALDRTPRNLMFSEEIGTKWGYGKVGGIMPPPTVVILDRDGSIIQTRNKREDSKWLKIVPDSSIPFSILQEKLKSGWEDVSSIELWSTEYRYPTRTTRPGIRMRKDGLKQLYYSVLLTPSPSQLIQLVGVDPSVTPPKMDLNFEQLAKPRSTIFYTIFVDVKGAIMGVESDSSQDNENVNLLSKVRVIRPGMRDGMPVPTAVIVAVPPQ